MLQLLLVEFRYGYVFYCTFNGYVAFTIYGANAASYDPFDVTIPADDTILDQKPPTASNRRLDLASDARAIVSVDNACVRDTGAEQKICGRITGQPFTAFSYKLYRVITIISMATYHPVEVTHQRRQHPLFVA